MFGFLKSNKLRWAGNIRKSKDSIGMATRWKNDTKKPRIRLRQRWRDRVSKNTL